MEVDNDAGEVLATVAIRQDDDGVWMLRVIFDGAPSPWAVLHGSRGLSRERVREAIYEMMCAAIPREARPEMRADERFPYTPGMRDRGRS